MKWIKALLFNKELQYIEKLLNEIAVLKRELNKKKVVECKNKECLDYKDGSCSLGTIIITNSLTEFSRRESGEYVNQSRCEDYDPGREMKEDMEEEIKGMPLNMKIGKVL